MIKRKATFEGIARRTLSALVFMFLAGVLVVGWAQGRDFSWALKERIQMRLSSEMGHPVSIDGPIGFNIGWSEVRLFAGGVTTNLGDEASALEASVFAERAGVALGLWDLVAGRVSLRGLVLREAQITLPPPEEAGTGTETADRNPEYIFRMLNRLSRVTLDNLTLIRLRQDAEPQVAEIDSLIIGPENGALRAAFVGDVEGTPYDVDAVIADLEGFLRFEGSSATITASIGRNSVEGRGWVHRIWPFEADLNLQGDAQNVARLAELMGGALPGAGAGRLIGHLSISQGTAEIEIANLAIHHNGANGDAPAPVFGPATGALTIVRNTGNRFTVTGGLHADYVRIDPLLAVPDGTGRRSVADVIERPLEAELPFAERSIPYRQVRRFSGDVRLGADELDYRDARFENVTVPLADSEGIFRIERASATYKGQPLSVLFVANAHDQTVHIEVDAHRIAIGELVDELGGDSFIYGPAILAVQGGGAGGTVGEVLRSFTGQSNLMIGRGQLERGGVDFLAADLLQAFFAEGANGTTPLVCLINRIDFEDGAGTSRAFLMDTNLITMTGQGQVNLARNTIDFHLAPRPKDPTLLSLASDYNVEGPIMNPSITPELGGLVRGVATTLGSLALTGGAAALLPLVVSSDDEVSNPCIAALVGEDVPAAEAP